MSVFGTCEWVRTYVCFDECLLRARDILFLFLFWLFINYYDGRVLTHTHGIYATNLLSRLLFSRAHECIHWNHIYLLNCESTIAQRSHTTTTNSQESVRFGSVRLLLLFLFIVCFAMNNFMNEIRCWEYFAGWVFHWSFHSVLTHGLGCSMLLLDYSFLLLICLISNFSNFTENHEIECNVFVFQIGVSMCVCVCVSDTHKSTHWNEWKL